MQKYLYAPNIREYERIKNAQGVHSAEKQWSNLRGKRFNNPQYSKEKTQLLKEFHNS